MKKLICVFLSLVLAAGLMGCSAAADRVEQKLERGLDRVEDTLEDAITHTNTTPGVAEMTLTTEEVTDIALTHAGLTADQVTGLRADYEIDNGVPQYDVDFYYENWEYDYDIHAESGQILSYDRDTRD